MMTQIDEVNSDRHLQMSLIEFIEGFSRVAEKASLLPYGELLQDWSDYDRINQPLHEKINNLIIFLSNASS